MNIEAIKFKKGDFIAKGTLLKFNEEMLKDYESENKYLPEEYKLKVGEVMRVVEDAEAE